MLTVSTLDIRKLHEPATFFKCYDLLPESEKKKILSIKLPDDKCRSLGARVLLSESLHKLGLTYKHMTQKVSANGKPFFPDHPEIRFNLSHSGDYAVCAVSNMDVGIDIEKIRSVKKSLAKRVLDDDEYTFFEYVADTQKGEFFIERWTKRESFMKYLGCGMTVNPQTVFSEYNEEYVSAQFYSFKGLPGYVIMACSPDKEQPFSYINVRL